MERNLVQRALFLLFCFFKPEEFTFGIPQRPLAAQKFLGANFEQLFHELHPRRVKPFGVRILANWGGNRMNFRVRKWQCRCPDRAGTRRTAARRSGAICMFNVASDAEVPGGAQAPRALRCLLDSREHLPQHFDCCTFELAGDRPPALQAMTSDHMVETARSG